MLKALAGLAALAVAMGIGRFAFTPVLPMMLQDAGLSIVSGGLLASGNYLGYLIGGLSAMVVRIQPERAIRGSLLVIGIVTLAMGATLPFGAWLALRLVAGIASAWVLISVSAWCLGALAVYQRPFLNSLVFAGVGTGIATAGLLCILLIDMAASSSAAWTALGVLSLAVCAVVWRMFTPHAAQGGPGAPAKGERHRWNVQSVRLVFCYGVFGFGYIIPATFLPVMAKAALQGSSLFAWSWPVFGLAAALSTLAVAMLVQRMGNRRLWVICHFIMAAGIILPVVAPGLPAIFAAAVGVGGTFMVITLAALQEAKRVAGRDATVMMAAMTSSFATGQIIGPLTVSGAGSGFSSGLIVAAVLLAASALLLMKGDGKVDAQQHS
ncbi:YbfB/YjiJ family MFS transporter [Noviherbaspirillum agri]